MSAAAGQSGDELVCRASDHVARPSIERRARPSAERATSAYAYRSGEERARLSRRRGLHARLPVYRASDVRLRQSSERRGRLP
ncbi:uncharacterized protein SCHCODRAFT_02080555 [Schizophyllum commune H4-8]|uniref:uncharacterized protein n=1 Tax=Schizophyllum commune (strain H4-8 / FGSC 9210) TaxID=578458 RepID=UPI0021603CDF|nr:uncharacterized protein SCHCODRAFT_02080555 [Schizophyllum commune H4-8]KAI5886768.1 hypothetical protein SCHCODRAFT_02080555 [Schizophyllum commune H4-8]